VLLFEDLLAVAERANEPALLVGRTIELAVDEPVSPVELPALAARARSAGDRRGAAALDYFVFPSGLFGEIPPFLVGRAGFDNWLVWRARQVARVVDVSAVVTAVHQAHEYGHLAGGKHEAYYGEEAAWNVGFAGGRSRIYTLHDASHRLRADGSVTRNLGSILRARETLRKVAWKLRIR
jgi:hypothetical protein